MQGGEGEGGGRGRGGHVDALDAVPEEVKVVHAVVHALHVLEDVGPSVGRGAKGGKVPGLGDEFVKTSKDAAVWCHMQARGERASGTEKQ